MPPGAGRRRALFLLGGCPDVGRPVGILKPWVRCSVDFAADPSRIRFQRVLLPRWCRGGGLVSASLPPTSGDESRKTSVVIPVVTYCPALQIAPLTSSGVH